MSEQAICRLCGEPMPKGEEMFFYHGYSTPCPKPPLDKGKIGDAITEKIEKLPDGYAMMTYDPQAGTNACGFTTSDLKEFICRRNQRLACGCVLYTDGAETYCSHHQPPEISMVTDERNSEG